MHACHWALGCPLSPGGPRGRHSMKLSPEHSRRTSGGMEGNCRPCPELAWGFGAWRSDLLTTFRSRPSANTFFSASSWSRMVSCSNGAFAPLTNATSSPPWDTEDMCCSDHRSSSPQVFIKRQRECPRALFKSVPKVADPQPQAHDLHPLLCAPPFKT